MLSQNYPSESELRQRQINTLKIFNANVTEIEVGKEYNIAFQIGQREFLLRVILSAEFPRKCPEIVITPAVKHPWVLPDGRIADAPGVINYTIHSDLGRVVQAIIREFERNQPSLLKESDAIKPIARVITIFDDLNILSTDELQAMNENVDKLDEYLDTRNYLKTYTEPLDNTIAEIEKLTENNLAKKVEYDTSRDAIAEKLQQIAVGRERCEELNQQYLNISDKYSPSNIKTLLHERVCGTDEQCDKIADEFLNGDTNVESFLQSYVLTRKLYHERKAKEEKFTFQLKALEKAGY